MGMGDWAAAALGSGYAKGAGQVLSGDFKEGGGTLVQGFKDTATMGLSARDRDKKKAEDEARRRAEEVEAGVQKRMEQSFRTQERLNKEKLEGTTRAFGNMNASDMDYGTRVSQLMSEAKNSSADARNVYNDMSSKYSDMQDRADREAKSAMTLSDYQNPNNSVMTGVRNVYNAEGDTQRGFYNTEADTQRNFYNDEGAAQQGMFEKNAGGETRRGQADYGVLSSLGAQSAGYGNMGPMTVGQQVAMMANSQRQAADAYAQTQKRVQALRDQGLQANIGNRNKGADTFSSLRGQGLQAQTSNRDRGLEQGFAQNDKVYQAGQGALDRQEGLVRDRRGLENDFRSFEQSNRGEREGFSQNKLGAEQRVNGRGLELTNMKSAQDFEMERAQVAETMRRAGKSEAAIQQTLSQMQADAAAYGQMVGAAVGTVGTVVGGVVGGPAGAAAGAGLGKAVASGAGQNTGAPPAQSANGTAVAPATYTPRNGGTGLALTRGPTSSTSSFDAYLKNKYGSPPANRVA